MTSIFLDNIPYFRVSSIAGLFHGGEGIQRELLFRKQMTLSVLTERRVLQPYGMSGGEPGKRGLNLLIKGSGGRVIYLGPKTAVQVEAGDVFSMLTPGGGGYGNQADSVESQGTTRVGEHAFVEKGSVYEYRMAQESV